MHRKDILQMKPKELKRLEVIKKIESGIISQKAGAGILRLSTRQVRRLEKKVKEEGDKGIIHGNRGRKSKRRLKRGIRERIIELRRKKYI